MTAVTRTNWPLILLLWAAGLGCAAQYGKVSVIYAELGAAYPDAGAGLGFLVSGVGIMGILFGATAGALVTWVGLRRALIGGLLVGAAISGFQALLPPMPLFLASRVVEGATHLAIGVAAPTMIAQLATREAQGTALSLWGTFFGVAYAALVAFGLPLVRAFGVASLFLAHAGYMVLIAIVIRFVIPADLNGERGPAPSLAGLIDTHRNLYTSAFIAAPAAGWVFYTFAYVSLLTLLPTFLDPAWRDFVIGAMPLIGIVISMTLGVWMLRFLTAVRVVQIGFVCGAASLIGLFLWPGAPLFCFALAAAFGLVQGAGFAMVPQLNASSESRALANGALAQAGNFGNSIGTPLLALAIVYSGYGAMILLAMAAMLCGLLGHVWLAKLRAGA